MLTTFSFSCIFHTADILIGPRKQFLQLNSFHFELVDVPPDGNCFYHSLLQDQRTAGHFQSTTDIRNALFRNVQEHLDDAFLRYIFCMYQKTINTWKNEVVVPGNWGSNFEALLYTYFYHQNVVIIEALRFGSTNSSIILQCTFENWSQRSQYQYLRYNLQTYGDPIYIFYHQCNNPIHGNRFNHFAYLKHVPVLTDRFTTLENTMIETNCFSSPNTDISVIVTPSPKIKLKGLNSVCNSKRKLSLDDTYLNDNKNDISLSSKTSIKKQRKYDNKPVFRSERKTTTCKLRKKANKDKKISLRNKTFTHIPMQAMEPKPWLKPVHKPMKVLEIWKECLIYGVEFLEPCNAASINDYKRKMEKMRHNINNAKCKFNKMEQKPSLMNLDGLDTLPYHLQQKRAMFATFERNIMSYKHKECSNCKRVSLIHDKWLPKKNFCWRCSESPEIFVEDKNFIMPTWLDQNGQMQYHVPTELTSLTVAEQLLIQRLSAYVPIVHIKNGTFGIRGSCCAFRQDVSEVCSVLPRKKVELIKYIRQFSTESGEIFQAKVLTVRRSKVMNALKWLKEHHVDYKNDESLVIDERNLDWMEGQEIAELSNCIKLEENTNDVSMKQENEDKNLKIENDPYESEKEEVKFSVSNLQRTKIDENKSDDVEYIGSLGNNEDIVNNPKAYSQIQELKNAHQNSIVTTKSDEFVNWPNVSKKAENEFNGIRIFVNTFPWLFPGGVGDYVENERMHGSKLNPDIWAKYLLHYFDGRFAKDKLWCFYALNYVERHRNQTSGSFFVNNFAKHGCPETLDELKQKIKNGDTSYIDRLQYFSQKQRGSDAYWRSQRAQVYSWIHHHIENGNGPPTLFLTLSCAEYYWPDIIRLLEERIKIADKRGECPELKKNKTALLKAVDEYSIVIQEYFSLRVNEWIETVGKKVFGIKHDWFRYEFAKGRGQIHIHMLCMLDNNKVMKEAYDSRDDKEKKVQILSNYMRSTFDLTAIHPATIWSHDESLNMEYVGHPEGNAPKLDYMDEPSTKYLWEVEDDVEDKCWLCNSCEMHECNAFCLRPTRRRNEKKCRSGCGIQDKETGKTPGFELRDKDAIIVDEKGIQRLQLKRNSKRMNQSSMNVLQSWRANCDVQLIVYDSDPDNPNLEEIGRITDYVVSYTCKGNIRQQVEKDIYKDFIQQ